MGSVVLICHFNNLIEHALYKLSNSSIYPYILVQSKGLLQVTAFCFVLWIGAPLYVSLPHFLGADQYYFDRVNGLSPDRVKHQPYFHLHQVSSSRAVLCGTGRFMDSCIQDTRKIESLNSKVWTIFRSFLSVDRRLPVSRTTISAEYPNKKLHISEVCNPRSILKPSFRRAHDAMI